MGAQGTLKMTEIEEGNVMYSGKEIQDQMGRESYWGPGLYTRDVEPAGMLWKAPLWTVVQGGCHGGP